MVAEQVDDTDPIRDEMERLSPAFAAIVLDALFHRYDDSEDLEEQYRKALAYYSKAK